MNIEKAAKNFEVFIETFGANIARQQSARKKTVTNC